MAKLTADQRRALEMLACAPRRGYTEASLRAHGFDKPMLADRPPSTPAAGRSAPSVPVACHAPTTRTF